MTKPTVFILFMIIFTHSVFAGDRVPVFVSIVPQKYFVQQIGRDLVDIKVMVRPGASPATYEPKPKQMADLSKTRIYFSIGVFFEKAWLKKIASANPQMKVVHTNIGIDKIPMATHYHHDKARVHHKGNKHHKESAHAQEDPYAYGGLDPHIWLSPPLVKVQAYTIFTALRKIDPTHRDTYEANYKDFISRIDELHAQLTMTFAGKQGLGFMVFHPAWGYFANTYGLKQIPIELEGKAPKPAQLKALIKHAREKNIKVIFVQPQFSTKSAELVAKEIGGQVAFADPLAADWMANLREIAVKFTASMK